MPMTLEAARKIKRPTIRVGRRYEFYCTMQQEYDPQAVRLRNHTGQRVRVLEQTFKPGSDGWEPGASERMYLVRADDGSEFTAFQGELNDWFLDTGQFFWPDGTYGPARNKKFLANERKA